MRFIAKRIKSLSAAFMAAAVVLTALLLTALPAYADTAAGTEKVGLNIRITGNVMGPLAYNAKERSVSGFTAEYQVGSGEWTATAPAGVTVELKDGVIAEASGTDAGVYIMGLSEASFDIAAQGYTLGHITVTDGSLEITKAGLTVAVNDQSYVYDGQPHGEGDTAYEDPAEIAEKVTVSGLQGDDAVASLILDGAETGINVYENRIEITGLSILNNGADVKDNYDITLIKGKLTITEPPTPSEYYDIYIANVRLNNLNAGDLGVIDGVDVAAGGEASFDPETNTLTLADVSINGPGRYTDNNYSNIAVSSGIQTLTIIFRGENSVSAEGISSNCNAMNCLNTDVIMEGEDDAVMNFKARFTRPPAENGAAGLAEDDFAASEREGDTVAEADVVFEADIELDEAEIDDSAAEETITEAETAPETAELEREEAPAPEAAESEAAQSHGGNWAMVCVVAVAAVVAVLVLLAAKKKRTKA